MPRAGRRAGFASRGCGGQTLADTDAGREHLSSVTVRGKALGQGPVLLDGQSKWPRLEQKHWAQI